MEPDPSPRAIHTAVPTTLFVFLAALHVTHRDPADTRRQTRRQTSRQTSRIVGGDVKRAGRVVGVGLLVVAVVVWASSSHHQHHHRRGAGVAVVGIIGIVGIVIGVIIVAVVDIVIVDGGVVVIAQNAHT